MKNSTSKKKILVIEDENSARLALVDKFEREGFDVVEATDGKTGLDLAFETSPDLILLDILMPQLGGLAMLKQLRARNTYGRTVPVILLTNLSADSEEIIRNIAETEPVYYIVKSSLTIQEVVQKVKDLLFETAR